MELTGTWVALFHPRNPFDPRNPLPRDPVLFEMYMDRLSSVLEDPEIVVALSDFDISAARMRAEIVSGAVGVLQTAGPEFAAYEESAARSAESPGFDSREVGFTDDFSLAAFLNWTTSICAALGTVALVTGLITLSRGYGAPPLIGSGLALLGVAGTLMLARWLVTTEYGRMAIESNFALSTDGIELTLARIALMTAIGQRELLVQVWKAIDREREKRFAHDYTVSGSSGLSEVYDTINRVTTETSGELEGLLSRLDGASIGIAGPRGSGKSMLIREYCEEQSALAARRGWADPDVAPEAGGDLRCMVAAPVDYASRDFVLHLFATFCEAVIQRYVSAGSADRAFRRRNWLRRLGMLALWLVLHAVIFGGLALALWHWQRPVARYFALSSSSVRYATLAVLAIGVLSFIRLTVRTMALWLRGTDEDQLVAAARKQRTRVRFLLTSTSGLSGGFSLPGGMQGQLSRGISRAEQPMSYPEIVDEFRRFARVVAAQAHRSGSRVFIGVDELDKIGSAEQAERFLNEIKGIFGIPHLYFIVSMSHDALIAFERRGLPLRDAFDSSFDEILQVGPLTYAESRRLLYRRMSGLNEPYVALCHCLAGGLARDLIRAARNVVKAATMLAGPADGADGGGQDPAPPLTIGSIADAVIRDELRRKLRVTSFVASSSGSAAGELLSSLHEIQGMLTQDQPIVSIIDLLASRGSAEPAIAAIRLELAAYVYFCATLQEIFTDQLDHDRIRTASGNPADLGSFDTLAAARNAFALETTLAWQLVTQFRSAWSMKLLKQP